MFNERRGIMMNTLIFPRGRNRAAAQRFTHCTATRAERARRCIFVNTVMTERNRDGHNRFERVIDPLAIRWQFRRRLGLFEAKRCFR
jgi:hypothetical protein